MAASVIYDFGEADQQAERFTSAPVAESIAGMTEVVRSSRPVPSAKFPPASVHPVPPAGHDSLAAAKPVSASEALLSAQASVRRPFALQPDRTAELRRCEDLFFTFTFAELVSRSSHLVEQGCQSADPYAFRCFSLLGQIQQGAVGEEDIDLTDLLRDYFRACELSVITEGATVCRLFLKLVFGDLVKRIARAQHGARFTLEKTDPICGGAFAILEGDFAKARQRFDAALADPGCRAYALAGIGMLKMFDSDLPGALAAFTRAGCHDDDILKLAGMLQH